MTMNVGCVKSMVKPYSENYKALFIEVKLTLREIHHFYQEVYDSVVFSTFTMLYKSHYHPVPRHFITPKRRPYLLSSHSPFPSPPTRNNPDGLQRMNGSTHCGPPEHWNTTQP